MKKAKRNKMIVISIIAVAFLSLVVIVIFSIFRGSGMVEEFSDGDQAVSFYADGRFTASLAHNTIHRGTYTTEEQGDETIVTLEHHGLTIYTQIADGFFLIPVEWLDACGHNTALPRIDRDSTTS
jgi:hypothetical protein